MADTEQGLAVVNSDMFLKRKRKKRVKSLIKKQIYDFSTNTTLHGLRYVTDRRLNIVEKIFWFVIFSISVGFCIYRILDVWTKWQDSPIIVTFNEHLVPVGNVPFPSVTICPQMKTKASKFNYTAIYEKILSYETDSEFWIKFKEELQIFLDISPLCHDNVFSSLKWFFDNPLPNHISKHSDVSFVENIVKVSPTMDDVFFKCYWRSEYVPCSSLFKPVLTAEGVCFNINSLQADDIFRNDSIQTEYLFLESLPEEVMRGWTIDGYYDQNEEYPYPRRGQGNGPKPELSVLFYESIADQDKMCNRINNGFKVYIQHPQELPTASMHHYSIIPDTLSPFALKLNILSTAENLKHVPSEIRQCFFPDERQLRYFKTYTENNCKLECLTNITYNLCSCVHFSMPYVLSNKICTISSQNCMSNATELMANNNACNCLPSCNSVDYDAEILRTSFDFKDYIYSLTFDDNNETENNIMEQFKFSKMDMYYKQPRYISTRRSELFGITDFLANCGGLLGLFLGFSFLSLIEIIYFITLRLWCNMNRDSEEK